MITDPSPTAVLDRTEITDVLYRYASCIDRRDTDGVRAVLADDLEARYGNGEPMHGGAAVAAWIDEMTQDCLWQHHFLSVYHVEVEGDRARALVYHTSHQLFGSDPETVHVLVGRYHDELERGDGRLEDQQARVRDPLGRAANRLDRLPRSGRRPRPDRLRGPREVNPSAFGVTIS